MQSMGDAIRLGTYAQIELIRPFIYADKAGIAEMANNMEIDLSKTWSCYVGGETHCGECGTCVERREAFILAGVPDPTVYLSLSPLPPKPSQC
jgi:7-cyano-7-deazaguanine synthase